MSLKNILLEIATDSSFSYDYKKVSEHDDYDSLIVEYKFQTEENEYEVYFEAFADEGNMVEVGFNSDKDDKVKKSVTPTEEGKALKVLSTVVNIAKEFVNDFPNYDEFKISFPFFDKMDKTKREKVYRYYINKAFPSVDVRKVFRELYIKVN